MVNKELVYYLKDGIGRGYDSEFLKSQLLNAGWNAGEVDEAIAAISSEKEVVPETAQAMPETTQPMPETTQKSWLEGEEKKGFKWMKLAGIIGLVFLALELIAVGYYFISAGGKLGSQGITIANPSKFVVITISILFLIVFELYCFGFVRMGKKTESRLIKFSGVMFMLAPLIFVILGAVSYVVASSVSDNLATAVLTGSSNVADIFSPIFDLGIIWIITLAVYMIIHLLFSIGLIGNRKQIKFSLISGVSHLLLAVAGVLSLGIFGNLIIKMKNMPAEQIIGNLMSGGGDLIGSLSTFSIIGYASSVVLLLAILFTSLALFDASKKFE